jgi:hypothetical protein
MYEGATMNESGLTESHLAAVLACGIALMISQLA